MKHSLYSNEEQVVQQAETMVEALQNDFGSRSGDEVLENLRQLISSYRKCFREQQRLVRFSDRQQEQLRQVTQELQGKTVQLQTLNQALEDEIEARKKLEDDLRRMATTDALTGVFNRRKFYELGQYEFAKLERGSHVLSLLMMDLDRFKTVNDRYGHAAGDEALRCFARVCSGQIRLVDSLGRLGGEEFGVLLPDTEMTGALEVAERVRAEMEACPITGSEGDFFVTISIGAVTARVCEGFEAMLARADEAMYAAKQNGRNRVESNGVESNGVGG